MTTAVVTGFSGCNVSASSSVANGDTSTPTLTIVVYNPDPLETTTQQYLFGASDVAGKVPNFSISLANKETDNAYAATYDGPWWATSPDALTWTKVSSYNVTAGVLTFSINAGANATIYVASVPPHTLPRTLAQLNYLAATFPALVHDDLRSRVRKAIGAWICGQGGTQKDQDNRTVSGLPFYGARYGNDAVGLTGANAKPEVMVLCGTHAGEWHGRHMWDGFSEEWLTSTTAKGIAARNGMDVYNYPAQAVGGMELGYRRAEALNSTSASFDMNREYGDGDGSVPTIALWQDIYDEQHGVAMHNVVAFLDFHDATKDNTSYGNAYFNHMAGMPNLAAITAILAAENSEWNAVPVDVNVTTIEFATGKGIDVALNFEARDERLTIEQYKELGRSVARAIAEMFDQGYFADFDGRALGTPEIESFETGTGAWTLNTGSVAWTRSNAATPTANTGADAAFNGSYRIFTEAGTSASPVAEGATFIAERTGIDFTKYAEMRFRWMRYGCESSTLQVQVDDGAGYVTRWSTSANLVSATSWKLEGIDLSDLTSTNGKVRFLVTVSGANRHNNDQDIDYIEFVPWVVAEGAPTLSVQNSTSSMVLGTVSLTQAHQLAIADASSDAVVGAASLTQAHIVSIAGAVSQSAVSAAVISVAGSVLVDGLLSGGALGVPVLTQAHVLAVNGAVSAAAVDVVALALGGTLNASSVQSAAVLAGVALTQSHVLIVDNLAQQQSLQQALLDVGGVTMSVAGLHSSGALTPVTLTAAQVLTVQDILSATVLTSAADIFLVPEGRVFLVGPEKRILLVAAEPRGSIH